MEQNLESNLELKNRIINFYNLNKVKIFIFIFSLITIFAVSVLIKYKNEKQNILIAEKYVEAGLNLNSSKKDKAKELYEEIILSKNNFYSILSLNTVIENNLISDKNKIIKYLNILEKSISSSEQKDLIILKKALYLIKESEVQAGNNLLKKLIEKNSILKPIAQELVKN
jgi:hypothetical protein